MYVFLLGENVNSLTASTLTIIHLVATNMQLSVLKHSIQFTPKYIILQYILFPK